MRKPIDPALSRGLLPEQAVDEVLLRQMDGSFCAKRNRVAEEVRAGILLTSSKDLPVFFIYALRAMVMLGSDVRVSHFAHLQKIRHAQILGLHHLGDKRIEVRHRPRNVQVHIRAVPTPCWHIDPTLESHFKSHGLARTIFACDKM